MSVVLLLALALILISALNRIRELEELKRFYYSRVSDLEDEAMDLEDTNILLKEDNQRLLAELDECKGAGW